jgi:hypothetical protein
MIDNGLRAYFSQLIQYSYFTFNFILNVMKSNILRTFFLFITMTLISSVSMGETLAVVITITDNCTGTPPQYYYATIKVISGDVTYCENVYIYNLTAGQNSCRYFSCNDIYLDYSEPIYEITVEVHRQVNPPSACYGKASTGLLYAGDLLNCNATVSVALN